MTPDEFRELLEKAHTWHEVDARNKVFACASELAKLWEEMWLAGNAMNRWKNWPKLRDALDALDAE